MSDPVVVKRNLQKMLDSGASVEEMEQYRQLEGLTPEEVRNAGKSAVGAALGNIGEWVSDTDQQLTNWQKNIRRQVTGPETGTRDLPEFPAPGGGNVRGNPGEPAVRVGDIPIRGLNDAAAVTDNDKDYGATIVRGLKDLGRYVGTEKDPNGYDIVTYRGDDGKEYVAYINAPGLTMADVNRELAGAIPAALSGFGASTVAKKLGLGLLGRTVGVGLTEAATSLARDVGARYKGAEPSPTDTLVKALVSAGGGALFEGLSGPISRGWRKLFAQKFPIVDSKGQLTPAARQAAIASGLDPDEMNERMALALRDKLPGAANPKEVGVDVRTGEFGIPTTVGQRTKNSANLGTEEEIRRGLFGPQAQGILSEFDKSQKSAIERAVHDSVGMSLAPRQGGREATTLGFRIGEGSRAAKGAWGREEDRLWDSVKGPLFPDPRYREQTILDTVKRNLVDNDVYVDQITTPSAVRMMDQLQAFAEGKAVSAPHRLLEQAGQSQELGIDEMRRRLFSMMDSAAPGTPDKRAASKIYGAYLEWIDDIAERGAINATPAEIAQLKLARGFSRDVKGLFEPRTGGKPNAAARIIQSVMEDTRTSSAEDVLRALVPSSPNAAPQKGMVQAIRHMRGILRAGGEVGQDTWDDIRLAYWVRLAQDSRAQVLSPLKLKNNIDAALANQESLLRVLYTEDEIKMFKRLSRALEDTTYKPPNPSGTSYELRRMQQRDKNPVLKTFLQTQSKRELFSKNNVLMSRIYAMLARKLPLNPFGAKDAAGARVAAETTSPKLTQRPGSSLIAPAGSIGARDIADLEFADDTADAYPEEAR